MLLCIALSALTARAEPFGRWNGWDDRLFQRIANTNGEPNDLGVMTMAQDATGFLWVGTQQGLVRWDGYRLRTYSADLNDPHGLPDGFIQSLWVGGMARCGWALHPTAWCATGPPPTTSSRWGAVRAGCAMWG